jgi:hypothetical protein
MEASFNERKSRKHNGKKNPKSKGSEMVTKSQVRSMIRSVVQSRDLLEWKYYAAAANTQNITFSGSLYPLSDVSQGIVDTSRSGDAISLVSLEVNWGIYAGTQANAVRIIILQWIPAVLGGPGLSQVILSTGSALVPFSPYAVDPYQQLTILYDQVISVSANEPLRVGRFRTKTFPRKSIQFTSGTLTGTNKLFMYVMSDDGVTPYPTFSYGSKIYFTDD